MTRAKKRLVLVGNWPETTGKPRSGVPTYVELLSQREDQPDSLLELSRAAGSRPEGVVDDAGVRWKFPGLYRVREHPAPAPTTDHLPTAVEVAAAAETLAGYREAAAQEMERPFLARASLGVSEEHPLEPANGIGASGGIGARPMPTSRAAALALGKAVHSALASWDLGA